MILENNNKSVFIFFAGMMATFFLFSCTSVTIKKTGTLHQPKTMDGFKITLEHFPPRGSIQRKYPVILCHGLFANRNYFKINEEQSIVALLQNEGYSVWLMDLRGRPTAGDTGWFFGDHTFTYNVDDYIRDDVNTALKYVTEKSGAPKVHWIGHSMGGMILYARLAHYPENRIASFIAYGSPTTFVPSSNILALQKKLAPGLVLIPSVPTRMLGRSGAYVVPLMPRKFKALLYNIENTNTYMEKRLFWNSTNDIANPEARQFIKALKTGEMVSHDQKISYFQKLSNVKTPLLAIAGRRDNLADPASVRDSFENVGSTDKKLMILSRAHGYSQDYGHIDMIFGRRAHIEVHPKVMKWINEKDLAY